MGMRRDLIRMQGRRKGKSLCQMSLGTRIVVSGTAR